MRIIAGKLSSRKIIAPSGRTTRPMTDRVRGAVFNIIAHHDWGAAIGDPLEGTNALDAFCGTGALAFEAISRGAAQAYLFDKDREALRTAKFNAEALGVKNACQIMPVDTLTPPRATEPCQLVFLAPPYRKNLIPPALAALDKAGWIAPDALIMAETAKTETLALPEKFNIILSRTYGDTAVCFLAESH